MESFGDDNLLLLPQDGLGGDNFPPLSKVVTIKSLGGDDFTQLPQDTAMRVWW